MIRDSTLPDAPWRLLQHRVPMIRMTLEDIIGGSHITAVDVSPIRESDAILRSRLLRLMADNCPDRPAAKIARDTALDELAQRYGLARRGTA